MSAKVLRSVNVGTGRTTVRLEPEFWAALEDMARRQGVTLARLIQDTDGPDGRTGALRVRALVYFRDRTTAP